MKKQLLFFILCLWNSAVFAEGHGPVFGLATPTLGENGWSSDTVAMTLRTDEGNMLMFREMIGYGVNEDLQINLSFPLSPQINKLSNPPRTRFGSMMSGTQDVELSGLWRFHRIAPDIGARFESTLIVSGTIPLDKRRISAGKLLEATPSIHVAAVTGYASRSIYTWVGGGYQHYLTEDGDRLGDLPYITGVFGWRPPIFRHDWPEPDWRIFVEALAEFPQEDKFNGVDNTQSGGTKVLIGPSFLGLYGQWGVSGGILFPVKEAFDGPYQEETYRAKLVFTWWL